MNTQINTANTANFLKKKYAFKKGLDQVKRKDVKNVKMELMNVLGIKTRWGLDQRILGNVEPRISEAEAIEDVFKKYGINDFWGL